MWCVVCGACLCVVVWSDRLVVGLANGWADPKNTILFMPTDVGNAYEKLVQRNQAPRGFVFWDIPNEGNVPKGQTDPLYMAQGINQFLHIR